MFSFHLELSEKDLEFRQPQLKIKTATFEGSFSPECPLPYEDLDVHAPRGNIVFSKHDGFTSLDWDEKKVGISLESLGDGKGSLQNTFTKVDNSLQQALTDWMSYAKDECAFEDQVKLIERQRDGIQQSRRQCDCVVNRQKKMDALNETIYKMCVERSESLLKKRKLET